jgi:ketosteroid isomerase-like protein
VQARITTAVASGDLEAALRELQGLSNAHPNDPAITGITTVVIGAARSAAQAAAAAADAAGASRNPSDAYKNAVAQRDAADAAAAASRGPEAAQGYLTAARSFTEAANAARNAPQATRAEPAQPAQATPTPPQTPSSQATPQRQPERPSSRTADTASIQTLLQHYAEAYAKMDVQALRSVWPGAPGAFSFAGNRSYTMNLRNPQLQWNGDKPTVTAVRHTIQELENGQKREASVPITITLRRISGGWVIDTIQ